MAQALSEGGLPSKNQAANLIAIRFGKPERLSWPGSYAEGELAVGDMGKSLTVQTELESANLISLRVGKPEVSIHADCHSLEDAWVKGIKDAGIYHGIIQDDAYISS